MKTILSSLLIFAALATDLPISNCEPISTHEIREEKLDGKHTREKKIKKEFQVSSNSNLAINNSYGNVDVTTWDENRIVIEVTIKTNGNDEDEVEEKLEEIHVEFNQNSSGVSAKTHYSKESKSWWKNIFSGWDNVNMEINYLVKAPRGNNLDINNDYGGIYIDKTTGNAKINCDYGKIDIGELAGRSNYLNFDYTRNSRIGKVTNAEINSDYSDYEIGEAESLNINADYSKSKIEKVVKLDFNCDYGSMHIGKVKYLKGDGDYLTTKIERIFDSAVLNMDYGSLSIDKVVKGAKNLTIDTDYTGVKIGYDNEMSFNFDVNTSYGGVDGLNELQVRKRDEGNTSKKLSGFYGDANERASFNIKTSYGSIKFIKQ